MSDAQPLGGRRPRRGLLRAGAFAVVGLIGIVGGAADLALAGPGQIRAGALVGGGLIALSLALASFARHRLGAATATEDRHAWTPPCIGCAGDPHAARRRLLLGGGAVAAAAVGVGAILRADAPAQRALRQTAWRAGSRLLTAEGRPVRVGDLAVGAKLPVWPEDAVGAADSQVMLIRVDPARIVARDELRASWSPEGHLAYSRLCTHMACPLGLYQTDPEVLVCPCHQAVFDVFDGGRPVHGPATRPLPQLPLMVDDDGTLRARSDFTEPVGASWWDRSR